MKPPESGVFLPARHIPQILAAFAPPRLPLSQPHPHFPGICCRVCRYSRENSPLP